MPAAPLAFVTIVSRNYLPHARVLARSLRAQHPEADVLGLLIDRPPAGEWRPEEEPFRVVLAEELSLPHWRRFAFQYGPTELACALKPHALAHALAEGHAKVVYLDADIQAFAPLRSVVGGLDEHDVVLTPHLTSPLPDDGHEPDELTILRAGALNAGCIALRPGVVARQLLTWWEARTRQRCVFDPDAGVVVDQKWLTFAPAMFENVHVCRDPACNVAYWNLPHRPIERRDGAYWVGQQRLEFFHFSGFHPERPEQLSKYQTRLSLDEGSAVRQLTQDYVRLLCEAGLETCARWGYGLARLSDGTPIDPLWREAVRTERPVLAGIEDPFDVARFPGLKWRLRRAMAGVAGRRLGDKGYDFLRILWRIFRPR